MADVMIVDDDQDLREILAELVAANGHRVRTAGSGEEGLRQMEEALPDVILLDLEMPGLGGAGLAHQMLVHNAGLERIPIVLLSGGIDLPSVARRIGTPYHLTKPVEPSVVLETLRHAVSARLCRLPPAASSPSGPER